MATVYVLNKDGKPLMPTTRCGHIRHLLKEKKARVVRTNPFTIKLVYETDDVVQPLYLGIDPGRTNIGVAVVKVDGTAVFTAHLETRNKEIPKLMAKRKEHRQGRRHYRRCKRQRRAAAHGTLSKKCKKQNRLIYSYPPDGPWYELKYIADELPNSLEAEISGGNQLIMNYEQAQELFGIKFRRWLGIFNL